MAKATTGAAGVENVLLDGLSQRAPGELLDGKVAGGLWPVAASCLVWPVADGCGLWPRVVWCGLVFVTHLSAWIAWVA